MPNYTSLRATFPGHVTDEACREVAAEIFTTGNWRIEKIEDIEGAEGQATQTIMTVQGETKWTMFAAIDRLQSEEGLRFVVILS